MAILIINSEDMSEKLMGFELKCRKCGSNRVALDIDWAAYPSVSWCTVTVICKSCNHDEIVYSEM